MSATPSDRKEAAVLLSRMACGCFAAGPAQERSRSPSAEGAAARTLLSALCRDRLPIPVQRASEDGRELLFKNQGGSYKGTRASSSTSWSAHKWLLRARCPNQQRALTGGKALGLEVRSLQVSGTVSACHNNSCCPILSAASCQQLTLQSHQLLKSSQPPWESGVPGGN